MSAGPERTFEGIRREVLLGPRRMVVKQRGPDYLLIDREAPNWIRTNEVGKRIVDLCDGQRSIDDIVGVLAVEFGLSRAVIEEEITPFLYDAAYGGFLGSADALADQSQDEQPNGEPKVGNLWLHVTDACNLACPYCYYEAKTGGTGSNDLSVAEIQSLLAEIQWTPGARIMITGGEVMLRDDIEDIARLCKTTGATVSLLTNGTVNSDRLCERLTDIIDRIQISFDGACAEVHDALRGPGSFAKSLATLERLHAVGYPWIVIAFTPTSRNLDELPKMARFAHDHGARVLHVNRYLEVGRACGVDHLSPDLEAYDAQVSKLYKSFSRLVGWLRGTRDENEFKLGVNVAGEQIFKIATAAKRTGCGFGSDTISVTSDGRMFPCPALHMDEHCIGNVRTDGFAPLYSRAVETYCSVTVDRLDRCRDCDFKYFCGGGCRAHAYLAHRTIAGQDPQCDAYLAQMEKRCWQLTVRGLPNPGAQVCNEI